jgi:hypothetical protein
MPITSENIDPLAMPIIDHQVWSRHNMLLKVEGLKFDIPFLLGILEGVSRERGNDPRFGGG